MNDREQERATLEKRQQQAAGKVGQQADVVRRLNGSAHRDPAQQQILNEMRQNKAAIDLNRALFDYDEEGDGEFSKP